MSSAVINILSAISQVRFKAMTVTISIQFELELELELLTQELLSMKLWYHGGTSTSSSTYCSSSKSRLTLGEIDELQCFETSNGTALSATFRSDSDFRHLG